MTVRGVCASQLMRFGVAADGFERVVIASDGLWDVCSPAKAASVARRASSAAAAAHKLAELAWTVSHQRFDRLKDGTTIVVVDLNLALERAAATSKPGCCTML